MRSYRCSGCGRSFRQNKQDELIPCPWCGEDAVVETERRSVFNTTHYVKIAKCLNNLYNSSPYFKGVVPKIALKMSEMFADDNPRFDDELFLAAVAEEEV